MGISARPGTLQAGRGCPAMPFCLVCNLCPPYVRQPHLTRTTPATVVQGLPIPPFNLWECGIYVIFLTPPTCACDATARVHLRWPPNPPDLCTSLPGLATHFTRRGPGSKTSRRALAFPRPALRQGLDAVARPSRARRPDFSDAMAGTTEGAPSMSARDDIFANIRRSLGVTGKEATRRASVAQRLAEAPRGSQTQVDA